MRPQLSPYLRLMRLHQRTGIWLLLWPGWWAIALAAPGLPPLRLLVLFALGSVLMRASGCIINDIVDRDIDARVERTRTRPLASGELRVTQAFGLLALLLALSFAIALALGDAVLLWAALSLPLIVAYPFMKRITWWPQCFLGLTFNWGALLGWVAATGGIGWPAIWLYAGGACWTLGYDTIYAHQDKEDDRQIGVKSSALRLGERTKRAVSLFYLAAILCWALAGWLAQERLLYVAALALAQLQFGWQTCTVDLDNPISCRRIFISNAWLGWLVFAGLLLGKL